MEVDDALHSLGRWSRWHLTFFLLLGISAAFPAAWHMMAIVFLGESIICDYITIIEMGFSSDCRNRNNLFCGYNVGLDLRLELDID